VKIDLYEIPVRDLYAGYVNSGYDGVVGYSGSLDIRPKFQREFVYDNARQQAVITTILSGFPLNVLNQVKHVPEVCRIYCATANPAEVLVAETEQGRGIIGVVDGGSPLGVETEDDVAARRDLLRKIGYKL